MNVLSLFDGISCGQVALKRADIKVDNYFASEIDKYAIKITQKNHPNTVQLGDINDWKTWDLPKIDLIMGGFPCQAWSIAGKQGGDKDPRGALMWTMLDIFNEIKIKNPNVKFLFENVRMKREFLTYVNNAIGCEPIIINSALVSAQNRIRCYWSNIPNITQPEDKNMKLVDIIEHGINYFKGGNLKSYFEKNRRQLVFKSGLILSGMADLKGLECIQRVYSIDGKSPTLTTSQGGHREPKINIDDASWRKLTPIECERLQTLPDNYTEGVSNTQRYKALGNGWTVDVIAHILKGLNNEFMYGL